MNVAVIDSHGECIAGLRPRDFVVTEDGIPESIARFGEGNETVRAVPSGSPSVAKPSDVVEGA